MLFAVACAHHDGGGGGGGGDSGVVGVATLTITPASATVALAPSGAGYTATQAFTVISTAADGTITDVTASVDWVTDDDHASLTAGLATVTAAGPYTITAIYGSGTAGAQLTATLHDTGFGAGFDPTDGPKLDGTPDRAQQPSIAYPIAGALFPVNIAPIEVHLQKSDPAQQLARIELTSGALLSYTFYAPCAASPNPGTFTGACIVSLGGAFAAQLAGVSEADDVHLSARLAAADGSKLGEATSIALAWSKVALTGGLYYWTTAGTGDTTFNTAIARYDFNGDASAPVIYLSSADAPKVPAGQTQCIGCHAISPDGAKLAFSLGGSTPGFFSLFDVATAKPTQSTFADKFADMSTFSPDGSRLVSMSYGKLTLRTADGSLGVIEDNLFADAVGEKVSHPFWGPGGGHFAFVSWNPSAADAKAGQITGDMVQGGQIWIADSDGTAMQGAPRLLVPRADGVTSYYPAISDDDRFVVFNQSRCAGPANTGGWGAGPCDGYNDISAALNVVPVAGGPAIALTRANGGDAPLTTNSWPRWSPDHGTFRGKRLYWLSFSSRRAYGLALAGATDDKTKPQLWFAAVAIDADGAAPAADPSFAPVWLPGQDPNLAGPRGNHTPAWTSRVVVIQ
jgi:hypothetical protein